MKDYYHELDLAIQAYEQHKPYKRYSTDFITDKICWCWKWKKITEEQTHELADRMTKVFEEKKT